MSDARLTIDLAAIVANWNTLNRRAGGADCGAVVKADAYGLGLETIAPTLARTGVRRFFVAQPQEARILRAILGPGPEIFVFSGYMESCARYYRAAEAWPLLNSAEQVAAFRRDFGTAPCGLQCDSGMNRLGVEPGDMGALPLSDLDLRLVMSHLACADTPDHPMNAAQLATFADMTAPLRDTPRSLAATGGILLGQAYHFDLVRPGIGLFGGLPFTEATPVVQLTLPVIQTRAVAKGEAVGYGAAWVAPRPSRIATLSAGYADGLIRALGNGAQVFVQGTACPIVGRVSMDLITIDVTDLPTPPEEVEVLGPHQSIDRLAAAAGTIGYEILTALGARYTRVYTGG